MVIGNSLHTSKGDFYTFVPTLFNHLPLASPMTAVPPSDSFVVVLVLVGRWVVGNGSRTLLFWIKGH